jgi:hypothetical protein
MISTRSIHLSSTHVGRLPIELPRHAWFRLLEVPSAAQEGSDASTNEREHKIISDGKIIAVAADNPRIRGS